MSDQEIAFPGRNCETRAGNSLFPAGKCEVPTGKSRFLIGNVKSNRGLMRSAVAHRGSTSSCFMAKSANSSRLDKPSLSKIAVMWFFTVWPLMDSFSAMSLLQ